MNEKIEVPTMKVPPLKKICMTIGQLPASYVETMSYYEMLVWFVHYLRDDIIPVVNANSEATQELQKLYVELQNYVNNYFDNLDVQEEINNKLDEMAESGQLTDIIAQYLGLAGMIAFDTVADMKTAENLVNGSKCYTLGYHSVNDGGNAFYKVRTITNDDIVDDGAIIALNDNSLIAELIIGDNYNVKQFGAYGDNTHDDTDILKHVIKFAYDKETTTGWKYCKTIYFPYGTYKITNPLIDSTNNVTGGSFNFIGNGMFNTSINATGTYVFDDNQYFGFTCFENLHFKGTNSNTFLNFVGGGSSGNAQSIKINKCWFNNFKTIINASGPTMTSEVTFLESKINNCGTNDNLCELFILNNSQAVNWRFYSTDIELFTGICFSYKKGAMIYYYQGSLISADNSKVIDLTSSDPNTFGGSNRPNIVMYGTKFELRNNTLLYNKGSNRSWFKGIFNECGMGGNNLTSGVIPISLGNGGSSLSFNDCSGLDNFAVSSTTTTAPLTEPSDTITFNNCDLLAEGFVTRSNVQYTGTNVGFLPRAIFDGFSYKLVNVIQAIKGMQIHNQIVLNLYDTQGTPIQNANQTPVTRTFYIDNFVRDIHIDGLARGGFGAYTFTATAYDDNDNEIGNVSGPIGSDNNLTIHVGKHLTKLKITTITNYDGPYAVIKPIIVSVDRL